MRNTVIIIFLLISTKLVFGQDIHFSQFFNNPLNINPAATAFSEHKYRLFLNHRDQWAAVSVPYLTYSASTDFQISKRKYQNDLFGIGLLFNSDKAGDSEFGETSAGISASYIKSLGKGGNNVISFGINYTFVQRSIDYSKLTFDNQYNGSIYIPSIGSGEMFEIDNFSYNDLSFGIKWNLSFTQSSYLNIDLAAWHLNRPALSFMKDEDVRLPIKYIFRANYNMEVGFSNTIGPEVFIAQQSTYQEILIGAKYRKVLDNNPYNTKSMSFGLYVRNKDAALLYTSLQYKIMTFAVSYDINLSQLRPASNYRGGLEFSFILNYSKDKRKKLNEVKCPVF